MAKKEIDLAKLYEQYKAAQETARNPKGIVFVSDFDMRSNPKDTEIYTFGKDASTVDEVALGAGKTTKLVAGNNEKVYVWHTRAKVMGAIEDLLCDEDIDINPIAEKVVAQIKESEKKKAQKDTAKVDAKADTKAEIKSEAKAEKQQGPKVINHSASGAAELETYMSLSALAELHDKRKSAKVNDGKVLLFNIETGGYKGIVSFGPDVETLRNVVPGGIIHNVPVGKGHTITYWSEDGPAIGKVREALRDFHVDFKYYEKNQLRCPDIKTILKNQKEQQQQPEKKEKAEAKTEVEAKAKDKTEKKQSKTQQEGKDGVQMVTVNGKKVSGGRIYPVSNEQGQQWVFLATVDGTALRPVPIEGKDIGLVAQCSKEGKPFPIEHMMEKYQPSKVAKKVSEQEFSTPKEIEGIGGKTHTLTKMNVYKESDPQKPDFGHYKFYAVVDGKGMSVKPSSQLLSFWFDRTMSIDKIFGQAFGERLCLPMAYEKYSMPEGIKPEMIKVHKVANSNSYHIRAELEKGLSTPARPMSYADTSAYFADKSLAGKLAGKYLSDDVTNLLTKAQNRQSQDNKQDIKKSSSRKI